MPIERLELPTSRLQCFLRDLNSTLRITKPVPRHLGVRSVESALTRARTEDLCLEGRHFNQLNYKRVLIVSSPRLLDGNARRVVCRTRRLDLALSLRAEVILPYCF